MKQWRPAFGAAVALRTPCAWRRQGALTRRRLAVSATLRPEVAVLGGGFGGLSTALRLASMPWTRLTRPRITIVDRNERFAFLPLLYEATTGCAEGWEVAPAYAELLADSAVRFTRASVDTIDLERGVVECAPATADGRGAQVPFDRVVVALGAQCGGIERVPGAAEHALPFYTWADAVRLKERLREVVDERQLQGDDGAIRIAVIGGGFSGVELATTLADTVPRGAVSLVERGDTLLKAAAPFNQEAGRKALSRTGVEVLMSTSVRSVAADSLQISPTSDTASEPEVRQCDIVVWTAGTRPNALLESLGLPLTDRGLLDTDEYLQIRGHEDRAYALGDNAAGTDGYYGTAQVAMQQAEYAAWNVWASLMEKAKLRARYAHLGEMMVLGAQEASVSTPLGVQADGVPGWLMRRATYLARMPTERHRMRVAASWAADPLLRGIERAASAARRQGGAID